VIQFSDEAGNPEGIGFVAYSRGEAVPHLVCVLSQYISNPAQPLYYSLFLKTPNLSAGKRGVNIPRTTTAAPNKRLT